MPDLSLQEIETFLREAVPFAHKPKEPTIFAVGGRGYYENPATDLLAFFLRPDAAHGLGDLFLSSFLECMGESGLDLSVVSVWPGERTDEGKRLDLLVVGKNWCLVIENKIYHWLANPLSIYQKHAEKYAKAQAFYVTLSPHGCSPPLPWGEVTYQKYCKALRNNMVGIASNAELSKWPLFAREFILHLENELYQPIMTSEQADFFEKHVDEFMKVNTLFTQYPQFLCSLIQTELHKTLPYTCKVVDDTWAIRIWSEEKWGGAYVAYRPPIKEASLRFDVSIYPDPKNPRPVPTPEQEQLLKDFNMEFHSKFNCWLTVNGLPGREAAIRAFIALIPLLERRDVPKAE